MRLHSLTLQAVGPFAGRHEISFAELAAGGLFLLEGPTGAGKSTVIDAIVFALYGKVAGAAASEDRLRSAFAGDDTETVVDLVFETGSGVYRVRRTPAYERAKRSGQGRTRQQASVKLWRLAGPPEGPADAAVGEIVSTRLDEVGAELTRVVGLDRTQFVQTMVLPQGEFASFLRADPEQRRGLLQRIFGTEVYERVQQRLEEARREVNRALVAARTQVQESVARYVGAAGADEQEAADLRAAADGPAEALTALVTERTAALVATADDAQAVALAAAGRAAEAHGAALAAAEVLRGARHRGELIAERTGLLGRAQEHAAQVERLGLARRAAVVQPVLRGLDEARAALAGAEKELTAVLDAAPHGLVPGGTDEAPGTDALGGQRQVGAAAGTRGTAALDEVRLAVARSRQGDADEAATLLRLVALEDGLPRRAAEVERLREAVRGLVEAMADLDAGLAARPAERTALAETLDRAAVTAATVDARRLEVAGATEVRTAVRDLQAAEVDRAGAVTRREEHAVAALAAAEEEARLRAARLRGFAGELAVGLHTGQPCPVCGSVEHPHLADLAPDHVSQEQVDRAEATRRTAEEHLARADAAVATLVERCAALARVAGGADLPGADTALAERQAALDEATAAAGLRDRTRTALDTHDAATGLLQARRAEADTERQAADGRRDRAEQDLDRDREEVEQSRGGRPTVAARHSDLTARVEAADALLDALDRRARTAADVTARTAEVHDLLAQHDLGSEDAARAAAVRPAEVADLERAVEQHRTALARVELGLAEDRTLAVTIPTLLGQGTDLDVAALDLAVQDPAVLAALAAAVEERAVAEQDARTLAEREAARRTSAQDRAVAATAAAELVATACRTLSEQDRAAGPVVRMAGLASGSDADNDRALSLATYVLVRRFEDVVAAANERLRLMSDGRYELERSEEREDVRTRRTGLAMRVLDRTTERARDPRTLSGGETFYVSLCLALGMADVVTAEAGGIELGTLFVDEGFGSLDPETLDAVLAELGRLRAGGRVVGVVSHVEAMKSAVAERIEVRRRPDGSSTLTVVAG
jgi:DNA repair protein SbcC/Rad50